MEVEIDKSIKLIEEQYTNPEDDDGFSKWISEILIKEISRRNLSLLEIDLLIMGFTFKKNC